jgi:hypothetical protein
MPLISQTTIINTINELSRKIDEIEKRKKRHQWIIYGLAASSSLMFLFSVVIPNKFDTANVCVKANCKDQSYKLIKSVYEREKIFNPKGFGRKTEIQDVFPGNELLMKVLSVLGTLGIGAAYMSHRGQTRALVALKQQRYEMSRLLAFWVDGNVRAYLEVSEYSLLIEKRARIDECLEIRQIEQDNRYGPQPLRDRPG